MPIAAQSRRSRRLDVVLVDRGLARSRARAQDLIRRGLVEVAGAIETRPGTVVAPGAELRVADGTVDHVSRGALKLIAALDHFQFSACAVVALDIGASTGGFTEVLLERGATRVYAVDVGRGQLNARLANDPRVVSLERTDARILDHTHVPNPIGAIVADVSFISLTKALPAALALAGQAAWLVALIKPQFEAGRAAVNRAGIVRDPADRDRAVTIVRDWMAAQAGWHVAGILPSPIAGGSGNQEFLLGAVRGR